MTEKFAEVLAQRDEHYTAKINNLMKKLSRTEDNLSKNLDSTPQHADGVMEVEPQTFATVT